ncbi:MAG: inositol monophosphatase [Hyphomonadaceae bacterium]
MTPEDMKAALTLAEAAAREAGAALAGRGKDFQGITSEIGHDIKLVADKAAEDMILKRLGEGSDHAILSEEEGWVGEAGSTAWVVDPLDGSSNYNREIPICAVSIALIENDRPVLGVIYDFNHDELYAGGKGLGATLNGKPMSVSDISETSKATLVTGFPTYRDYSDEALAQTARDFARWKKIRMIGSATLSTAWVACGRADAYSEESTMLWDIAAGAALIEAAGGRVFYSDGPIDKPMTVSADNGALPCD